ncbi:hypothetical protein ABVT39_004879 [Epinephelus coioides]
MSQVDSIQQLPFEDKPNSDLKKLETTIKHMKLRKFKRDEEDYNRDQVYLWDKRPRRTRSHQHHQPPARDRRVSFNLTSSEDELHQPTTPSPPQPTRSSSFLEDEWPSLQARPPRARRAEDERKRGPPPERPLRRTGLRSGTQTHEAQ